MEKKYDVFICYSPSDARCVNIIVNKLHDYGFTTTWKIENEAENKKEIIENVKVFLYFSSSESNNDSTLRGEVCMAIDLGKPLIVIRLDDSVYDTSIAELLESSDTYNSDKKALGKLHETIEKKIEEDYKWVFISHSTKDLKKVRWVRNALEKEGFHPILFYLKCLSKKTEVSGLIKREIDARHRFILCDSPNAQKSEYVRNEVDYILSKNRFYETINLNKINNKRDISNIIESYKRRLSVSIRYNNEDQTVASIASELKTQLSRVGLETSEDNNIENRLLIALLGDCCSESSINEVFKLFLLNPAHVLPVIINNTKIFDSLSKNDVLDLSNEVDKKKARAIVEKITSFDDERFRFWNTVKSRKFVSFVKKVMRRYYGPKFFVKINKHYFGVLCILGKESYNVSSIKDYDCLCDMNGSRLSNYNITDHQEYIRNKWYIEYCRMLDGKIHYPNRPGYMLDKIITDEDGRFDKMQVHVGTFAENVYSTHVLEYELYRAYQQFSDKDLNNPEIWEQLKSTLTIRNSMHSDVKATSGKEFDKEMRTSLLNWDGKNSLLSVQMLVIIKSRRTQKYEVKIVQRSNYVVIKPGVYQFIPSGGFEILNDSNHDTYDDSKLIENFSPGRAIFREYLEELFNAPEFRGTGDGSIEDRLLKDPRISTIENMLKDGKAEFHFLGSVIELAGLRHELSFALIIHDELYSENKFIANEECSNILVRSCPVQDFDGIKKIWNNIHAPSAAMWYMFQNTDIYKSLISS